MSEIKQNFAIVIGINNYTNLPKLKTAVCDAKELAKVLKQRYNYRVLELCDNKATKTELAKWIEALKKNKNKKQYSNSRILFYFAGHGFAEEAQDSELGKPAGYFMPQDAQEKNKNTWLSMEEVYETFSALNCHHLLMILDCCFAGRISWIGQGRNAARSRKLYQQSYDRFIKHKTEQIITSAAHDEEAQDLFRFGQRGKKNGNSPFAHLLLKVLKGDSEGGKDEFIKAIAQDGVITTQELFTYLQNELGAFAANQTPGLSQPRKYDPKSGEYVYLKGEYIFPLPKFNPDSLPKYELNKDTNPYKSLASFDTKDSHLFFGRTILSQQLADVVKQQPLTIVLGASGSGKSSLVKAGLIPTLKDESSEQQWQILAPMRPGGSPFKELNKILKQSQHGSSIVNLPLAEKIEILCRRLNYWAKDNSKSKILLVIDQSEELLTLSRNPQLAKDFLTLLTKLLNENLQLRIVLTLRSDFESQIRDTLDESNWQQAWQRGKFTVTPMNREELQQIIEEPAAQRALFFESPKLVHQLIDEAIDRVGILPLLSFTLSELYLKYLRAEENGERSDRTITQADYEQLGGVEGSLAQAAKRTYRELVEQKIDSSTINNVMLRMVALNGSEITRRRVSISELNYPEPIQQDVEQIINHFVNARLFTTGQDAEGQEYVEPVHDALVTRWQKLISKPEIQENLILQRRLTSAAEDWDRANNNNQKSSGVQAKVESLIRRLDRRLHTIENLFNQINVRLTRRWQRSRSKLGAERLLPQPQQFLWNGDPYLDVLEQKFDSNKSWFNEVEAEFVRQSIRQKRQNVSWRWRIAGSIAFIVATTAIIASVQWVIAQRRLVSTIDALTTASQELFDSNQEFDALQASINAGKQLKQTTFGKSLETEYQVKTQLQQALYWVKEQNRLEGHEAKVLSVSSSPNGQLLASASADGSIKLWDTTTGKQITTFAGHGDAVHLVSFSPDGQLLASASTSDQTVKLWDLDNLEEPKKIKSLAKYDSDSNGNKGLSFSPDGQYLAYASVDNKIKLFEVKKNKNQKYSLSHYRDLIGHRGKVNGINFSPDGKMLVSASFDGTVKRWNLITGKASDISWLGHPAWVFAVSYSPDGTMLASGADGGSVKLWDMEKRKVYTLHAFDNRVTNLNFSPDGEVLIASGFNNDVKLWDVTNREEIDSAIGHRAFVNSVSTDGQLLASASDDASIKLWNIGRRREINSLSGHDSRVNSVSFSPDKRLLATGSKDRYGNDRETRSDIKLWDVKNSKVVARLKGHSDWVESITFSRSGKLLASGSWDNTIKLWDIANPEQSQEIATLTGHSEWVTKVNFSPDEQLLASGSWDDTIKLWNVSNPQDTQDIATLEGHEGDVFDISFSPDGRLLASGSGDKTIKLWDVSNPQDPQDITTLGGHKQGLRSVDFSPDGKLLASASDDATIKLWDVSNPQDPKKITTLEGHKLAVRSISFSPDGKLLASAGDDQTIRLWDVATRREINLNGQRSEIYSLDFSSDGQLLVSGSESGQVILWNNAEILSNFTLGNLLRDSCNWLVGYLKNNPNVEKSDRHICDGVSESK